MKVLLVSGHTDLKNDSVANKNIIEQVKKLLPEVEIDDLSSLYPDFNIDIEAEQKKLVAADVVVLQFPVFWYSQPSILHRWMEKTFAHGFSHGSTGTALKGKKLIVSCTTGAPAAFYEGKMAGDSIVDYIMLAHRGTAFLTGMELQEPIVTYGVSYASRNDEAAMADMIARTTEHAERLVQLLKSL